MHGSLVVSVILVESLCFARPSFTATRDIALTGSVSSPDERQMEGVVVTARRDGAIFDVSVTTDARGVYAFPKTHLVPGTYTIKVRAIGYELASSGVVEVTSARAATLDLSLVKTRDRSSQLTSMEWLMNMPGTDEQKSMVSKPLMSCTYCHSLERVVKSKHSAEQFVPVLTRMQKYYPDGSTAGTEGRGRAVIDTKERQNAAEKNPRWANRPVIMKSDLAAYLATINASGGRTLPSPATLPRPTGKATRVIVTQYDMPRKDTVPHDSDVDSKGAPWYTDQSRPFLGTMNPKTGTFSEWPLPEVKDRQRHPFQGGSDVTIDNEDNVWFPATSDEIDTPWGFPIKFNPRTQTFTRVEIPPQAKDASIANYVGAATQFLTAAKTGKIWAGFRIFYRIDPQTMKVDFITPDWAKVKNTPLGNHNAYEIAADSQSNPYVINHVSAYIVKFDMKKKDFIFYKVPTSDSGPRRGRIDSRDRFWFAEYSADKIGLFDTRAEKFQEWALKKWTAPYTVSVPDKHGRVFAPSSNSDRLLRLDPKTGEIVEYLMPTRDFDVKQLSIDPITRTAVWMSNVRNARLIKVEPLD